MIPSGYKTSKVYSVKPTDGSGDMAFSRSNDTATRVNSAGLIEKVRTNVALYSEQFDNAYWGKANVTVTSNTTANPVNGAATADTLTRTGGASGFLNKQIAQTGVVTFSIFAKAGTTNEVRLNTYDGAADRGATYNLTTGAITGVYGSPLSTSAQSFGGGWYRISIAVTSASYTDCQVQIDSVNSVIIFGAQLESGDIATDYIATTSAAVSVGPVANVPRLDYLGSSCPRLLLEPQRTNRAQFSEQFSNAFWTKDNVTISSNVAVSPDGFTNADKVVSTAANGEHLVYYFDSLNGGSGSLSVFVKKAEYRYAILRAVLADTGLYQTCVFDFDTLTFPVQGLGTGKAESYGNGWYRISVSYTLPSAGAYGVQFGFSPTTDHVYTGDGTSGGFAYGFQFEAGAYATSYIPTLGSASTRGSDAAYKASISTLIGQTEGVAFIDFVWNGLTGIGSYPRIIELWGDSNNYIQLYSIAGTTSWGWDVYNGGTVQFTGSSTMALGRNKIAIAYKLNDMAIYKNGTLVASDTSCTVPATSSLGIAGSYTGSGAQLAASVNQTLLFKTRLSNADLAALTA